MPIRSYPQACTLNHTSLPRVYHVENIELWNTWMKGIARNDTRPRYAGVSHIVPTSHFHLPTAENTKYMKYRAIPEFEQNTWNTEGSLSLYKIHDIRRDPWACTNYLKYRGIPELVQNTWNTEWSPSLYKILEIRSDPWAWTKYMKYRAIPRHVHQSIVSSLEYILAACLCYYSPPFPWVMTTQTCPI